MMNEVQRFEAWLTANGVILTLAEGRYAQRYMEMGIEARFLHNHARYSSRPAVEFWVNKYREEVS